MYTKLELIKDMAPLVSKLTITILLAYMVFTGRLNGSLLAALLDAVGKLM